MKILGVLVAGYIVLVFLIYLFQKKLCYAPKLKFASPHSLKKPDLETITLNTPDGLKLLSYYKAPQKGYPVILFFHGNTGTAEEFAHKLIPMADTGYGLLLLEYRGFDNNKGDISEQGVLIDARTALEYVLKREGQETQIIYYGMSMGTGVANGLAYDVAPFALVQECGFTSFIDVAKQYWWFLPVKYIMKDTFLSVERIKSLKSPVLVLHGEKDKVVYVSHGKKMFDTVTSKDKKLILYPDARHTDLYDFGASTDILEWLENLRLKHSK